MPQCIDWTVIEEWECTTNYVYIPATDDATSGPTVGTGFDIGQHNSSQIASTFGKGSDLDTKLKPLAGMKGKSARDLFKGPKGEAPKKKAIKCGDRSAWVYLPYDDKKLITLNAEQQTILQNAVRNDKLSKIVDAFNKSATGKKRGTFDTLPGAIQTAIVSFQWQWGEYIHTKKATDRRRKLFEAFTSHDWNAAMTLLADGLKGFKRASDPSPARRDTEINLILDGMNSLAPTTPPGETPKPEAVILGPLT